MAPELLDMESYDAIVVGAGPAGGQCARELAKSGKKVLLAERNRDFSVNNYSSAGAPLEIMAMFHLPESVVSASWNKIMMHSSHKSQVWEAPERKGVIMDFMKLRSFLAQETKKHGGEYRLGFSYQRHEFLPGGDISVWFTDRNSRGLQNLQTKVLIDATGCERQVLASTVKNSHKNISATGIEYLVEVKPEVYKKYAEALSVYMGHKWMPQGYSWIFPMEANTLKVGVGRYFQNEDYVPHHKSYLYYMDVMMKECLGTADVPILDKHGKTIVYTYKQKDPHYDRNVIAIGDSVSTINPLAFEGIRHAMVSGRIAAKHILDRIDGRSDNFDGYVRELKQYFGYKWSLCELLMNIIYKEPKDERIDMMLAAFRRFSMDEMLDLSFHYKVGVAIKFLLGYMMTASLYRIKRMLGFKRHDA